MTERALYTAMFYFMLLVAVGVALARCDGDKPGVAGITRDTVWRVTQLPPERDTVTATVVIRKAGRIDTVSVVRIDSFFRDLPPFSLRGAEFITSKRDTITAEYHYQSGGLPALNGGVTLPLSEFRYNVRYSPDTVLTITTREYIQPSKLQFGAQIGTGIVVGIDGTVRPAAFLGVGLNYKF